MQVLALVVLTAAAIGGAALALVGAVPRSMRIGHGAVAGIGLVLLLIAAVAAGEKSVWVAFGLILTGFAAGGVLFSVVFTRRKPPGLVIAGHGLLNTAGVLLLAWVTLYPG